MRKTLDFLFANAGVKRTPEEWNKLLEVKIIDNDGWKRGEYETPVDLTEYVRRVGHCTINQPPDRAQQVALAAKDVVERHSYAKHVEGIYSPELNKAVDRLDNLLR